MRMGDSKVVRRRCASVLAMLLMSLLLVACQPERLPPFRAQIFAMGTLVELTIVGAETSDAEAATAAVDQALQTFGRDWWAWGDGALARVNRQLAHSPCAAISPEMSPVLTEAKRLAVLSDGLFNPAVGRLVALWGFNEAPGDEVAVPSAEQIAAELPVPEMELLRIDQTQICAPLGTWLDLGGFAKGVAVDRALDQLRQAGIDHAIVNAGGDLRVMGQRDGLPWRVGIRNPRGAGVIATVKLDDGESVFTSGDYERTFVLNGQRYHHIIDPNTGYPVSGVQSVTVIHTDAAVADAAATALFVAGVDHWQPVARAMGVRYVLLVDEAGRFHTNPGMAARLLLDAGDQPVVIVSSPL